jgi:hypothetical protein
MILLLAAKTAKDRLIQFRNSFFFPLLRPALGVQQSAGSACRFGFRFFRFCYRRRRTTQT